MSIALQGISDGVVVLVQVIKHLEGSNIWPVVRQLGYMKEEEYHKIAAHAIAALSNGMLVSSTCNIEF